MAPSTLGTFLRAFSFGRVRQLDCVLDVSLARTWNVGGGAGELPLVIDVDSFIGGVHGEQKQARPTDTPAGCDTTCSSRSVRTPVRCWTSTTAQAKLTPNAAPDELLARVRRTGHTGQVASRTDAGFQHHKVMRALDYFPREVD
jgi:hypothetical protein